MEEWRNGHPYANCYVIFMEMIDQIIHLFNENFHELTHTSGDFMNFKKFTCILNFNESALNLNNSWKDPVHRSAVVDFIIDTFKHTSENTEEGRIYF